MSADKLWYRQPAENFDQALPVGNGRIGGMVYGGITEEVIGLNEDSVWSGGPRNRNNQSSMDVFHQVRELLLQDEVTEAESLTMDAMVGVTPNCRHYMPLCDMKLSFPHKGKATNYKRELSLSEAISTVSYETDGVRYERQVFVSHPDEVMIIRLTASEPGKITFRVCLDGRDDYYDDNRPMEGKTIIMTGGCGGEDGINFAASLRIRNNGGRIYSRSMHLVVEDADEAIIFFAARTNYRSDNYVMQTIRDIDAAYAKSYDELLEAHLFDYQELYYRCELKISSASELDEVPTDEALKRLGEVSNAPYAGLAESYFNYGRYLMISGSRPGTLPLNLQGIWNKDMWPAWGGRFTININTEMNYWPVEICNLSECHEPLFDLIERMRVPGRMTAQTMYDCQGFVAHHNTDLWGDCAPQDVWIPATVWPMGAAWLCLHIYEHYRFTLDRDFLEQKYETLKEAALFFVSYLFENKEGYLVTGPSVSPENVYRLENGQEASVCMGPSMDSEIIYELFSDVIEASVILGRDQDFAELLKEKRAKLSPLKIGKYGQIQEWAVDYDEVEIGHRHISQLFALYPGCQISPSQTPELANAARATLERRLSHGGGHTGWSRAWIINFWARLLDGQKAGENIRLLLSRSTNPNMLDSHPPFQIDGNFGGCAGIAECILQSQNHELYLLPALPPEWQKGFASGLKARDGFEVSLSWNDCRITDGEILSVNGKTCSIRTKTPIKIFTGEISVPVTQDGDCYTFYTEAGKRYIIEGISNE